MPTIFPLQVLDARADQLPKWDCADGTPAPPWVRQIAIAHALGQVDVIQWFRTNQGSWEWAVDLDSVMFAWRYDGAGVWTICSVWFDEPDDDEPDVI